MELIIEPEAEKDLKGQKIKHKGYILDRLEELRKKSTDENTLS